MDEARNPRSQRDMPPDALEAAARALYEQLVHRDTLEALPYETLGRRRTHMRDFAAVVIATYHRALP